MFINNKDKEEKTNTDIYKNETDNISDLENLDPIEQLEKLEEIDPLGKLDTLTKGKKTKNNKYNKNKVLIIGAISFILVILLSFLIIPHIVKTKTLQSVYDNGLNKKEVSSVEYIKYEDNLFRSVILEKRISTGSNSPIAKEIMNLNNNSIPFISPKNKVSEIFSVKFKDNSSIIIYISDNNLGIDYAKIWVKDKNIKTLIKKMDKVNIVTKTKK